MSTDRTYQLIVIGISAGGINFMNKLLSNLSSNFTIPIVVIQHVSDNSKGSWVKMLNEQSPLTIKEADEKEKITEGTIYFAPANYHLLIEQNKTFTLTLEDKVNYARPSIDVTFETAADCFRENLIGIIGTGANADGAKGLKKIKHTGGHTIVEDPSQAETPSMPEAAIKATQPDLILSNEAITKHMNQINQKQQPL